MFLKRLESVGFKSFAERISIDFVPGVTAVVGPNGSGKSNITDAIRWVLGEQSAKSLRGSKMEDIIFQGSDTRKKLNVAEVSLILDNSDQTLPIDYEEVSVTRRVYRSGESEFYINKQACRLKDIVDLFLDSGLGREAFSIISQGKVEEILSSKAEERRTIFEEAAGVLKYKQRKKKAEFKLAETEENLNRVEDIIYEIEQQIDPLQEQSEIAKQYLTLKEHLKDKEISLLITEIEQLHSEWKELNDQLTHKQMKEIELKTFIQEKQAETESVRQKIQVLDDEIEQLQQQLLQTTQQLEQSEGQKQVLHERAKHFNENKEKLELEKEKLTSLLTQTKQQLAEEKKKLHMLEEEQKETKKHVKRLKSKLTTEQDHIADRIEELKANYIELLNKQAADRNEKQSTKQQLTQLKYKSERHNRRHHELLNTKEELDEKEKLIKTRLSEKETKYFSKEKRIKQLKKELEHDEKVFQQSQKNLYQGYQHIEKLKSKKEMLEEMKKDFQGFYQGVKAVLKASKNKQLEQIHGAIIELIDIPNKYLTAMETVLGGQAQHIVVTNDEAARKAITWLKKTNNGRATFLPLESIQPRYISQDVVTLIENHSGYIGIAANLVKTANTFQKAVAHLMGHVLIVHTLKDANEIARLVNRKYRIVTLDGDVVNPGGSMSGGAQKKRNQSLFTRDKELKNLASMLVDYERKASEIAMKVELEKQQFIQKEQELKSLEKSIYKDYQLLQQEKTDAKQIETQLASIQENLKIYMVEKEQYDIDIEELTKNEQQITEALAKTERELIITQNEIASLTEQEKKLKENKEEIQNEYHEYQIKLAEQEERSRNQREKTETIREQLYQLENQYEAVVKEWEQLMELKDSEETIQDIKQNIEEQKEQKEKLMATIQSERSKRMKMTQSIQDQERELKEQNKQHQMMLQDIQKTEVHSTRLDVELENRLSHLETEYMITFEKACQSYEKTANITEEKRLVKEIKQQIEALGTVNLGAIDEYKRISERYEFLEKQKNDLLTAKQTLYDVIAEMDTEMKRLFNETFTQIKEEFTVVFKELFAGGRAELKLTDPKNLLDTGVDIIAQPPGKKLQHLGLLSGGERALTAIALLFAILRVRPVPFCVLDEVEAALDEANVIRFAKYVKQHSERTQFIVITHRQGTMEEADVLYGVTMQESGVSRLVSVRLEESGELIKS